jgi:hypothetical protein
MASNYCDCPIGIKRKEKSMKDSKKKTSKQPRAKNANPTKNLGKKIITAKAITTSKASRGFSTKRPAKVHLSYPL